MTMNHKMSAMLMLTWASYSALGYSPKCLVGEFCELRPNGVLGSTYSPGPTPISVPGWDRHSSGIVLTLGTFSTRLSELVGAPPGAEIDTGRHA